MGTKPGATANAIGLRLPGLRALRVLSLTANREDEEPWRLQRLNLLAQILGYQGNAVRKITGLHDHKGILAVNWDQRPSEQERRDLEYLWEVFYECEIEHYLNNRPLGPVRMVASDSGPFYQPPDGRRDRH